MKASRECDYLQLHNTNITIFADLVQKRTLKPLLQILQKRDIKDKLALLFNLVFTTWSQPFIKLHFFPRGRIHVSETRLSNLRRTNHSQKITISNIISDSRPYFTSMEVWGNLLWPEELGLLLKGCFLYFSMKIVGDCLTFYQLYEFDHLPSSLVNRSQFHIIVWWFLGCQRPLELLLDLLGKRRYVPWGPFWILPSGSVGYSVVFSIATSIFFWFVRCPQSCPSHSLLFPLSYLLLPFFYVHSEITNVLGH